MFFKYNNINYLLTKYTMNLKDYIDEIKDFPKLWIEFKDMSPILANSEALDIVINSFENSLWAPTKIIGLDARGFIFWSILAYKMKIPFIMLRKEWKLPWKCERISYKLEYWENTFEIKKDSIKPWDRIAIVDDLIATGWTIKAAIDLVERLWASISSVNAVIELKDLNGRELFKDKVINTLVKY